MATKTATPAIYCREPGGVFTPAAALHKIIDDLGSATPWAMLAFGLAPRPRVAGASLAKPVVATHSGHEEIPPQNNLSPNKFSRNHVDSHGLSRAGFASKAPAARRCIPLNYAVRYETESPAPAAAMTSGGRG
ncbi:hypothetical protein OH491_23210 [Termitidicoccus mucosus]|uniref:Uncharacterized protein n=1 Tax=Termitidicoccus mucosus TaxID=1184151 RepID=A0A178INB3_9BACT|nr:hypothetical protein AW736_03265 [Opitutaceae bacterium TSB47]